MSVISALCRELLRNRRRAPLAIIVNYDMHMKMLKDKDIHCVRQIDDKGARIMGIPVEINDMDDDIVIEYARERDEEKAF